MRKKRLCRRPLCGRQIYRKLLLLCRVCSAVTFLCVGARCAALPAQAEELSAVLTGSPDTGTALSARPGTEIIFLAASETRPPFPAVTGSEEILYQKGESDKMEENAEMIMEGRIDALAPGDVLGPEQVTGQEDFYFAIYPIVEGDAVYGRINGKSYRENDDIGLEDLRYLKVLHYNFDHEIQVGELIVNADVADDVLAIFRELYDAEYEIQSLYLVDNYWTGDGIESDEASIEVNNSSAFNYREITGGGKLSNHALGRAIDINPQQNPYVLYKDGSWQWEHENAAPYIDRNSGEPHMIAAGDVCYNIFVKHGFSWGGEWENPLDYQHFDKE